MRINIRNMVCNNCVNVLRRELTQNGFAVADVGLGYVVFADDDLRPERLTELHAILRELGFEMIEDRDRLMVEKVKLEVIRHLGRTEPCRHTLSHCIAEATNYDYKQVSRIFSALEGRTIEKFYVSAKVEKVKELLSYGDIPLSEIAYRLGYSSVAFLSRQFKQETGMTPTQYQHSRHDRRALSDI